MNKYLKKKSLVPAIIFLLYTIFFISIFFSFRAISSMSIGLLLITGIIKNKIEKKPFFQKGVNNLFLAACTLFFLFHIIWLAYTQNMDEGWRDIRLKSGLLVTPLAVCCTDYINPVTRQKLLSYFCILLAAGSLYCLITAFLAYRQTGNSSVFFYHALVSPFKQHAVYFSLLVFIALVFLSERLLKNDLILSKPLHISLILFFSVFLFLLSSKLVLAFYLLYLVFFFTGIIRSSKLNRSLAIGSFILLFTIAGFTLIIHNPVSERFDDIMKGDLNVIKQDKFSQGDYFNGLQFRLLQWKFVPEILNENHRWWTGVGPADAQSFLDQKYISMKMYTGDPARGDRGYLIYNTHNQFLESILQTGIAGLLIFLLICYSLIKMAWKKRSRVTSFIIALLLAWSFTESVFETQYGILIFTFFPLFMCLDENRTQPLQNEISLVH